MPKKDTKLIQLSEKIHITNRRNEESRRGKP